MTVYIWSRCLMPKFVQRSAVCDVHWGSRSILVQRVGGERRPVCWFLRREWVCGAAWTPVINCCQSSFGTQHIWPKHLNQYELRTFFLSTTAKMRLSLYTVNPSHVNYQYAWIKTHVFFSFSTKSLSLRWATLSSFGSGKPSRLSKTYQHHANRL